jgi:hypothetical protein
MAEIDHENITLGRVSHRQGIIDCLSSNHLRRISFGALSMIILLSILHWHGFSLPSWHRYIDSSQESEVLIGSARAIRSDDWLVTLPFLLAQEAHAPRFPGINHNIGLGQYMNIMPLMPVANPIYCFRPLSWGFLVGPEFGLSFLWWGRLLGLLATWFAVFFVLSNGMSVISGSASLLLVFSPFNQIWTLNGAELAIYGGWIFLSAAALSFCRSKSTILLSGLVLGWSLGCFAIHLYPPYQVVLTYLILFVFGAFWLIKGGYDAFKSCWQMRCLAVGVAIGILTLCVGWFLYAGWEGIQSMVNSDYPGLRFTVGGLYPNKFWTLFVDNAVPEWLPRKGGTRFHYLGRDGFFLIYPVVGLAILFDVIRHRRLRFPLSMGALIFLLALHWWLHIGLPEPLAKFTFLSRLREGREIIGRGYGNALLLVCWLAECRRWQLHRDWLHFAFCAVATVLFFAACHYLNYDYLITIGKTPHDLAISFLLLSLIVALLPRFPRSAMASFAGVAVITNCWFNPLVKGGVDYLKTNPVAEKIQEIHSAKDRKSRWAVFGFGAVANLFRVLNVPAINGVHFHPQPQIWQEFDVNGTHRKVYNRYAHTNFDAAMSLTPSFRLPVPDTFVVDVNPIHPAFSNLGVTHFLVVGNEQKEIFETVGYFRLISSLGDKHFYDAKRLD